MAILSHHKMLHMGVQMNLLEPCNPRRDTTGFVILIASLALSSDSQYTQSGMRK